MSIKIEKKITGYEVAKLEINQLNQRKKSQRLHPC